MLTHWQTCITHEEHGRRATPLEELNHTSTYPNDRTCIHSPEQEGHSSFYTKTQSEQLHAHGCPFPVKKSRYQIDEMSFLAQGHDPGSFTQMDVHYPTRHRSIKSTRYHDVSVSAAEHRRSLYIIRKVSAA